MFGDLNLKFIDWTTETIKKPINIIQSISRDEKIASNLLLDFVNENLLIQTVTEYTRKGKSILDLVLTNDEDIIFSTKVESNNLDTDHDTVTNQIYLKTQHSEEKPPTEKKLIDNLNFNKAEWNKIRDELSEIKWSEVFNEEMSVSDMSEVLETQITTICAKHTPEKMEKNKVNNIPRNRLVLIRRRKRINGSINYLKYVKEKQPNTTEKISKLIKKRDEIESEIKQLIKEEILKKEIEAINKMKRNPKFFYQYVKKFSRTESNIGPLQDGRGNLQTDSETKANLLQNQYITVFSNPKNAKCNGEYRGKCNNEIKDIIISIKDIIDAIKEIPTYAAPGPDKIPAIVLRECADQLAEAILQIWRKSLDTGEIPEALKLQTIIPLFKKGSKSLPENYRPVSLTSHLIKLFERVLRRKLIKHIEENNLLSDNQHAFRAGRSCLSQLLQHMDSVLHALENKMNIDVVYLDFAKAFDEVDHYILMQKVKQFGIKGKLHTWLNNFLTNRYQQVIVNGTLSRKEKVISGVPQGTVLGPLLFLIYINDLESALKHSILRIFADDSKIVKEIVNEEDHNKLQEDLNISLKWALDNNMQLNQKKFQLMQYGKNEELKETYTTEDDEILQKEEEVKDLGVHLSEDLSWETQTTDAVKKGRKFMGWILRSFRSRSQEVIVPLYQTYVIPRLEYASVLWMPYQIKNIVKLDAIQRTITSKIEGLQNLNYHQRLHVLKLYSMQRRRERYVAIYMYKIVNEMVPNNLNLQFYNTSRQGIKCRQPKVQTTLTHLSTVRQSYFTSTGPAIFNLIPRKIKEVKSLELFKNHLDKFLMMFPDLPPTPGYTSVNKNTLLEWATGNYNFAEIKSMLTENGVYHQVKVSLSQREDLR